MNLKSLSDQQLLTQTKRLVQEERQKLAEILHHLREVERRKLYSDIKYRSLFDYAVQELRYSEGQACRRIAAMKMIGELPEVEEKIKEGSLSLTNLYRAQTLFAETKKNKDAEPLAKNEKLALLATLENKSTRDAEKIILSHQPTGFIPKEKERLLTEELTEIRFVLDNNLRSQIQKVKNLLGVRGLNMSFLELLTYMTETSLVALKQKRFGKSLPNFSPLARGSHRSINSRYVPSALRKQIWNRDDAQCTQCSSRTNLNIDHIQPVALGGTSTLENLRLLCFNCNQRQAIKSFGVDQVRQERR